MAQGDRGRPAEAAHRGGGGRTQARIDSGAQTVVGVNRYRPTTSRRSTSCGSTIPPCGGRRSPSSSGSGPSATRPRRRCARALTGAARGGTGNLLALAVDAARAHATVGEISGAWRMPGAATPRHRGDLGRLPPRAGDSHAVARSPACGGLRRGPRPRPRILVAKVGQDGHDRARRYRLGLRRSRLRGRGGRTLRDAGGGGGAGRRAGRPFVGISSLAAGHLTLVPAVRAALDAAGRSDIMLVVGGVIPPDDVPAVRAAGVAAVFPARDRGGRGRRGPADGAERAVRLRPEGSRRLWGRCRVIGRLNHVAMVVPDLAAAARTYAEDLGAAVSPPRGPPRARRPDRVRDAAQHQGGADGAARPGLAGRVLPGPQSGGRPAPCLLRGGRPPGRGDRLVGRGLRVSARASRRSARTATPCCSSTRRTCPARSWNSRRWPRQARRPDAGGRADQPVLRPSRPPAERSPASPLQEADRRDRPPRRSRIRAGRVRRPSRSCALRIST